MIQLLPLAGALLAAEIGGSLAAAGGLPRVVGQIGAGIVVGPSLLGLVGDDPLVGALATIGALAILASAGLETDLAVFRSVGRGAALAAVGGVVTPFLLGLLLSLAAGLSVRSGLLVGAVLTATSVGITAAVLAELGLLAGRAGATILAAAVMDDVLGLFALTVAAGADRGAASLVGLFPAAAVLGLSLVALRLGSPWLHRLADGLHARGGGPAAALAFVLLVGWLYQTVGGLAAITGAYVAGLALAGAPVSRRLRVVWEGLGEGLCTPLFFVVAGLAADVRGLGPWLPFAVGLVVVAVLGKLVGCGLGARLGGLGWDEAGLVGVGMVARGEVALVAATVGLHDGAIDAHLYGVLVVVALVTTILAPLGIHLWVRLRGAGDLAERVSDVLPAPLTGSLRPDTE